MGFLKGSLWNFCGISILNSSRISMGFSTGFLCDSYTIPYRMFMGFLWDYHDIPIGFL